MKFLLILTLLFSFFQLHADELGWVNRQIQAIAPNRVGLSDKDISKLKNPFIFLNKNRPKIKKKSVTNYKVKKTYSKKRYKSKRKRLMLDAIMNKSALINGTWYKVGQSINGYKIVNINNNSILLTKNNKKIQLSTVSTIKNFNFTR